MAQNATVQQAPVGVTVGKFNPPHLRHLHLIETAAGQIDHLYALLGDRSDQTIPAGQRKAWLVVAMVLLSKKKVESWWLWILPVNVSAIALYLVTGAYMFAAFYVLFLVMAFVGLRRWMVAEAEGTT